MSYGNGSWFDGTNAMYCAVAASAAWKHMLLWPQTTTSASASIWNASCGFVLSSWIVTLSICDSQPNAFSPVNT